MVDVGGEADPHPGHDRRVAQGAGAVAVPGADLLVGGHHAADARGRAALSDGRPQLEGCHAAHGQGPKGLLFIYLLT